VIPVTYPSSLSAFNRRQMEIYPITPTASQIAWTDYIPVRFNSAQYIENTTDNAGYMAVNVLSSTTGKQAWVDYVPVVIDSNRTDAWQISANGYIPVNYSGTGDGTAANKGLSLNFLGADRLDPRITFSRASNATVTGSNGLIQYAPHNLLTFSEQFDNSAWVRLASSISPNAEVAPNGTTTADFIVPDNTLTIHQLSTSPTLIASASHTVSLYVKSGGYQGIEIYSTSPSMTDATARFDTSTGIVFSSSGGTAKIENIGNGWYRCSLTYSTVAGGTSTNRFRVFNGTTSNFAGDGTSGVYIWGAQLEIGSTATTYNPTTVKNLLGFSEAFDNAAWTKSNSFIQTNLLTYSENFDNAAWAKTNSSVTANTTTAPNSTTTADSLIESSATGEHYIATSAVSFTSGSLYTFSCYVKPNGRNWFRLSFTNSAFPALERFAYFDVQNGVVGTVAPNITAAITSVGNGWYRCSISRAATITASASCFAVICDADNNTSYTGDGTSGLYVWGAQLVQGSVAGDYQQTTSSALPVMYQAPNGTLTADKLVENTVTDFHIAEQNFTVADNDTVTFSVYAKAGERQFFNIRLLDKAAANKTAVFDLANGTTASADATITSVGNGWYRCSLKGNVSAGGTTPRARIYLMSNSTTSSYAGDGTSGIYIWGAQLSDSASLDQYVNNPVAAPSSTAYYGPRFDYDPVTLQPRGLLIEEQRANLLTYSEQFDNAAWTKTGATITANSVVSPNGTTTADSLVEDTSTGNHWVFQSLGSAAAHSCSVYLKAGSRSWAALRITVTGPTVSYAYFNLSTGVVGTVAAGLTASITSVGNGWYRCTISGTMSGSVPIVIAAASADNTISYTGDGSTALYLWGAQLEAGAFATSYIPTVASQVTRSADVAVIQGSNFSSFYNVNEGSIYCSSLLQNKSSDSLGLYAFDDGTTNNTFNSFYTGTGVNTNSRVSGSNVFVASAVALTTTPSILKTGFAYQTANYAASINAGTPTTQLSGAVPVGLNRVQIGRYTSYANGHIRQIAYYPRRLQNSELQAITS